MNKIKLRKDSRYSGIIYFFEICWMYDKKYIIYLALAQGCKVFLSLNSIILPKYIIDSTFYERNIEKALFTLFLMIGIVLFGSLISSILKKEILSHKMQVYKQFQLSISERMMNADFEKIESDSFLSLKAKAEKFLYGEGNGFASVLENAFELIGYSITILSLCGIIVQLNALLLAFVTIILGLTAFFNYYTQKKNISINLEKSKQERNAQYFASISQDFRYGKEIRSFGIAEWIVEKYASQLSNMQGLYNKIASNNSVYDIFLSISSVIQQIVIYFYVIKDGITDTISVGQFSMYLSAVSSYSTTLRSIIHTLIRVQQYSQYYTAYKEYMEVGARAKSGNQTTPQKIDKIEIQNVSYIYPGQSTYALKNVNLTISAGDKILLVGENGAGKTTLVNLLLGIYKPTTGRILVNGINIMDYAQQDYIKMFSTVFQDFKLFAFPICENIALSSSVDEKKLLKILSDVGLYNKVMLLKKQHRTNIYREFDNGGFIPSGGESQKIAMSRAIYRDSDVIILDEPTSAIDPRAEYELINMFDSLFPGRTSIYISHRLSSVKLCNRIVVLKGGELVEHGTHDELLKENGVYATLFKMQAEKYI